MLIMELLVNENLLNAETELNRAESGNIIELCRKYLLILTEYRDALSKLRSSPEVNFQQPPSPLARELTEQIRKALHSAIEITTRERNQTEHLLESLTVITGYEAADTFNYLKYKGFDNWEMRSGGVRVKGDSDELMSIPAAIERASQLRSQEYVARRTVFIKQNGSLSKKID